MYTEYAHIYVGRLHTLIDINSYNSAIEILFGHTYISIELFFILL